jgi:hypothetical protein
MVFVREIMAAQGEKEKWCWPGEQEEGGREG